MLQSSFLKKRLKNIDVALPEKQILARLGYNTHRTEIDIKSKVDLHSIMHKAYAACENEAVWGSTRIDVADGQIKLKPGDSLHTFVSADLSRFLADSSDVIMIFATCGRTIVDTIEELKQSGKLFEATVYDAVASEVADAVMGWTHRYCRSILRREGFFVGDRRFSPGYGDLSLEVQMSFYELLDLQAHNIEITERFFIVPEKSVTAFVGVKRVG